MRPLYLLLSLFCLLVLAACGSEDEITPPSFSNIEAIGSLGSTTPLTAPSQDPVVTITGHIDDLAATIVANTVSGEESVTVQTDGNWEFDLTPKEGTNIATFTASDQRGNINQLVLTVHHDTTAPLVTAVKQGLDPLDPNVSQLVVTFNEALLQGSLATALFAIDGGTPIAPAPFDPLTPQRVTLPLVAALTAGDYTLTYVGVTDNATPIGNSTDSTSTYSFTFKIQ